MNYFQALEYFTNWGIVLAAVIVVIALLAFALLITIWRGLVYRHRQESLISRLRRRVISTLNNYPPPGSAALIAKVRPILDAGGRLSWIEVK